MRFCTQNVHLATFVLAAFDPAALSYANNVIIRGLEHLPLHFGRRAA